MRSAESAWEWLRAVTVNEREDSCAISNYSKSQRQSGW